MQVTPFIQLLRIALGTFNPCDFAPCDDATWEEIFEIARRQSVIGLIYKGMMMLPEDRKPGAKIKVKIAVVSEKIQAINAMFDSKVAELYVDLKQMGLKSCLLKGQGIALYYDEPSLRQCGDIDMWVGGERREILRLLSGRWKTKNVFYHHVDVDVFGKTPEVEIHFTPSWMNNPFVNRRMQKYFREAEAVQLERMVEGAAFPVPDITFNLIFNMAHIYRHLLFEGVGMRQIVDYYYLLVNSNEEQRAQAMDYIRTFRMKRFASAMAYVLQELFDIDRSLNICEPSRKYGEQFLKEIFRGGNFGKYDSRNKNVSTAAAPVRFYRRMKRLFPFLLAYPSEVLWAPVFKIYQYALISGRRRSI